MMYWCCRMLVMLLSSLFLILFCNCNKDGVLFVDAFTRYHHQGHSPAIVTTVRNTAVSINNKRLSVNHSNDKFDAVRKSSASLHKMKMSEKDTYDDWNNNNNSDLDGIQMKTLLRVGVPSLTAAILAAVAYPSMAMGLAYWIGDNTNNGGVFAVLSQDSSQFVQNFLTVSSLLFSILVGQTYYFLYLQQESIYYALFDEVTEAKSLLEQVSLVCRGRSSMYQQLLQDIRRYVRDDLLASDSPAESLSARPVDDPLEAVLYWTSVGVPSSVYDTVKSLRAARAARLGALQRKLPAIHMAMLWMLATVELCSFPLLGAGTQTLGGYNLLTIQGILFGTMTFGIVTTLTVVNELWQPSGGAYNVDKVLSVMVQGLEEELEERLSGKERYLSGVNFPTPPNENEIEREIERESSSSYL